MAAETEFPPPGAAVPGAPPPLRRSAGTLAAPPAGAEVPAHVATVPAAPAASVAPAAGTSPMFVAAALAGAAVGLWLERVWGR